MLISAFHIRQVCLKVGVGYIVKHHGCAFFTVFVIDFLIYPAEKLILVVIEKIEAVVEIVQFEIFCRVAKEIILIIKAIKNGYWLQDLGEAHVGNCRIKVKTELSLAFLQIADFPINLKILFPKAFQHVMSIAQRRRL